MSKLSKDAFAVMAICAKINEHFGITVDPRKGTYTFCWGFKMKKERARKEGYDATTVRGAIDYDPEFNGCPYCGAKRFYICNQCGKIVCYDGEEYVTCPNCGGGGIVRVAESFDLTGGNFYE